MNTSLCSREYVEHFACLECTLCGAANEFSSVIRASSGFVFNIFFSAALPSHLFWLQKVFGLAGLR